MTSFCVYGVKHSDCLELARKQMPSIISDASKKKTEFTLAQWSVYCDLLADHLFHEVERSKQISAAFDAPQFAEEWIALARRGNLIRNARIMTKGQKTDAKGAPMVRKGKPVIGWIPYEQSKVVHHA